MIFGVLLRILVWTMPSKPVVTASGEKNFSVQPLQNFSAGPLPNAIPVEKFWEVISHKSNCDKENKLINLNWRFPGNLNLIRGLTVLSLPDLETKCKTLLENFGSTTSGHIFKGLNELRNLYPVLSFAHFSSASSLLPEIARLSGKNWRSLLESTKNQDSLHSPLYVFQTECSSAVFQQLISVLFFEKVLHDSSPVLLVQFNLGSLNVDVCKERDLLPQGLHNCNSYLTECKVLSDSDRTGLFECCCKNDLAMCINATVMEEYRNNTAGLESLCAGGTNSAMRRVLLCINAVCIVAAVTLIFLVITQRRTQQYGARGWALIEIFLIGAVFLYGIIVLDFLDLRSWSCCIIQWFRELGFSLFYGALVLKIYRNLIENRVRKAHHVYVKEKDMLKYMIFIAVITITSLLAWTLGGAQAQKNKDFPFISVGNQPNNSIPYRICQLEWWSSAWHMYELTFLAYGLWLCYKARNTAWVERWQFTAAVGLEVVITFSANMIRYYAWYSSNRDAMFLVNFIHIHLTVSLNIILIIVPKFYYIHVDRGRMRSLISPNRSSKAHPSLAKLRDNLVNGTIDFAEVPITDMNPEDIRAELKRVYTQLRMYKLKNIYHENPHISSKRRGKKQSDKQNKRRVSIPTPISLLSKDKSRMEEEERSSTNRSLDEEPTRAGLCADLTVHSSPHNVYLAREALAATKKFQLEKDLSVRV